MMMMRIGGEGGGGCDGNDEVLDIFCAVIFQVLHIMY